MDIYLIILINNNILMMILKELKMEPKSMENGEYYKIGLNVLNYVVEVNLSYNESVYLL